ncbi:Organic cation transporter 1, partial [Stegodyphus mimosarum]
MPAEMEFENILEKIGGNGRYQTHLVILFLIPITMLLPIINMNVIFMASVPDHWCYEPEVATFVLTFAQQKALISPPNNSECYMYDANYTNIFTLVNFTIQTNSTLKHCDKGWQYDKTDYEYTVATEWNLVCDDAYYPSLILTLHNLGSIIGTPILGFLADRFGRKRIFFFSVLLGVATELPSALFRNLTCFIILRTINGGLFPTMFQ